MAKWSFLVFIALLAFAMNAAVLEHRRELIVLMYGLVAVRVFALSLLLIWAASYYASFYRKGFGIIGHALVFLAAGLGFVGIGHFGLIREVCVFPNSEMAAFASKDSVCSALSVFAIALGVFMLWPSLKVLHGMTSGSTRSGAKTRPPI